MAHRFADSLVPHQPRRARAHGSKVAKSHLRLVLDQEVRHHRRKYRVDQIFLVLLLLHQGTLPGLRERCDDLLVHKSGPLGGLDEVPFDFLAVNSRMRAELEHGELAGTAPPLRESRSADRHLPTTMMANTMMQR